jgi:hypothetical protein
MFFRKNKMVRVYPLCGFKMKGNSMIKFAYIGIVLGHLSLFGMELERTGSDRISTATSAVGGAFKQAGEETGRAAVDAISDLYIPQNIDVTCCLENSAKCCYAVYGLCKIGIGICEIASLICGGICVTEIKEYPQLAWGLGLGSVVSNGATLGLTYALFRMENKIRKLDQAVGEVHRRQEEATRP